MQKRYSTYDRELLAVCKAIRYFFYFLEGHEFVYTDHKPLVAAFKSSKTREMAFFAEHSSELRYVTHF